MKLEICCADLPSLQAAIDGGADRIELCQALGLDGLTPSAGMIEIAVKSGITVHVLIRPREGDFVYSEAEIQCMLADIRMARQLGAAGVVIGALTPEGDIDMQVSQLLADEARGMHITFHRAFDVCRNPIMALEQIIALGCDRLLTSGQAPTAEQGIPLLRQLVAKSKELGNTLNIMPGAGVNANNIAHILKETGATEIHGSLRKNGHTDADIVKKAVATFRQIQASNDV